MARVGPYGDSALVIDVDDVSSAHRVAAAIDRARRNGGGPAGIVETVVGLASVVVHVDPAAGGAEYLERWLIELINDRAWEANPVEPGHTVHRRHMDIPVSFDGQDLDGVAATIGGTRADVVELLTGAELHVAFVGFAPGFPYLVGLPPELAAVPRRDTPRVTVPAGSVAVGGGFASVYPRATPGGWLLLGHTSVQLFDPDRPPYAFLRTGDTVRFTDLASAAVGGGSDRAGTRHVAPSPATGLPTPARPGPDGNSTTDLRPHPPVRRGPRSGPAEPHRGRWPSRSRGSGDPTGRAGRSRCHATGQSAGGQPRWRRHHRGDHRRSDAPVHRRCPRGRGDAVARAPAGPRRWPPGGGGRRVTRTGRAGGDRGPGSRRAAGLHRRVRRFRDPRWWSARGPPTCCPGWAQDRSCAATGSISVTRTDPEGSSCNPRSPGTAPADGGQSHRGTPPAPPRGPGPVRRRPVDRRSGVEPDRRPPDLPTPPRSDARRADPFHGHGHRGHPAPP